MSSIPPSPLKSPDKKQQQQQQQFLQRQYSRPGQVKQSRLVMNSSTGAMSMWNAERPPKNSTTETEQFNFSAPPTSSAVDAIAGGTGQKHKKPAAKKKKLPTPVKEALDLKKKQAKDAIDNRRHYGNFASSSYSGSSFTSASSSSSASRKSPFDNRGPPPPRPESNYKPVTFKDLKQVEWGKKQRDEMVRLAIEEEQRHNMQRIRDHMSAVESTEVDSMSLLIED